MHSAESISGGPSGLLGRRAQRMHKGRHIFCRAASMARISGRERASLVRRVGAAVERHAPKIMKMSMLVGAMACLAGTRSSSCMPRPVDLDETLEPTFTDGARKYWHLRFTSSSSPRAVVSSDRIDEGVGSSDSSDEGCAGCAKKLLRLDLKEIKALRAMGRAIKGYFARALPNGGTRRKYAQQKNDDVRLDTFAGRCTKKVKIVTVQVDSDGRRTLVVKEEHHQRHTKHAGDLEIYQAFLKSAGYASHLAAHPSHKISFTLFKRAKCIGEPHQRECADEIKTSMRERLLALNRLRLSVKERQATKECAYGDCDECGVDQRFFRCPCEDTDVEVKLREYRLQPRTVKGEDDEGNSISSTMAVKGSRRSWSRAIDAKTSKSRRSTLSLDKYFYRFITWTQDDPIGVDDDDVFFADKSAKWSASPPCSCSKCRVKDYDNCRYKAWTAAPEMRQSDGWTRTTIILKPPSGDDRSSARRRATGARTTNAGSAAGRDGWNIKKGEFCLTVRWFDLKPCGYYEDYGSQDEQLLEMVIAVGSGAARARARPSEGQGAAEVSRLESWHDISGAASAGAGGTVVVPYVEVVPGAGWAEVPPNASVAIGSAGGATVNGTGASRFFVVRGELALSNLTLVDGYNGSYGGGVASAFGTGATAAADAALGENLKSIAHAVFAVAVAVLFAFLYDNLAPFLEDSVDAFADVVQFLLFVNLFTILILDCDAKMQTAEERTGLSRAGFGTANTVGALGALVVALSTNGKIAAAAVVARDKARTASCRAIESAGASEELVRKFGLATARAADEVAALEPAADRELEAAQARPASVPPSPRKTTPRRSSPASTTRSSRRSPAATRSPSSRGAAAPPPATPRFAATASPRSRPRK
ncbi:oxidoreductase [Aureococcus anophagefferens]|nr:oxidoreductase [Aureococcus anophagefferens]